MAVRFQALPPIWLAPAEGARKRALFMADVFAAPASRVRMGLFQLMETKKGGGH